MIKNRTDQLLFLVSFFAAPNKSYFKIVTFCLLWFNSPLFSVLIVANAVLTVFAMITITTISICTPTGVEYH